MAFSSSSHPAAHGRAERTPHGRPTDHIERRAELIAERARIRLDEFEDIDGYCRPGCPRCAITLAREEVDACYGWTTEDARVTGDVAEARAAELLGANAVHGRVL